MEVIRPFQVEDAEQVKDLLLQLTEDIAHFNPTDVFSDQSCHAFVINEGDKIIGFGSLIVHLVPTKGMVARLEDIVVHTDARGKGLGRKICSHLIEVAKAKNVKMIDLTSNPSRVPARKLYESLGFELRDTGVFRLKLQ